MREAIGSSLAPFSPPAMPALGVDGGTPQVFPVADDDAGTPSCEYTGPPAIDVTLLPACDFCQKGRCLPAGLISPGDLASLADCDEMSKCVPEPYIESLGKFVLESCRSIYDSEGRCVSTCIPAVASQDTLPTSSCSSHERCVPCFDPITGNATGACATSCDPGPQEEPAVFEACCDDLSVCVPTELVPASQHAFFASDECAELPSRLCIPKPLARDPNYRFAACTTQYATTCAADDLECAAARDAVSGAPGNCVPACLLASRPTTPYGDLEDIYARATCAPKHLCAPCNDPMTGAPTGTCLD